jgi:hypothetical protein
MTHKFGCKLPHSVEEALEIDRQTGTDHWQRALNKEMSKVKVAWNACDDITPNDVRSGKVKDMIGSGKLVATLFSISRWSSQEKQGFVLGDILPILQRR